MSRSDDQPGLRLRLAHEARRITVQHGYLNALESTSLRVLERGTPAEAREALVAYRGALDAHFALEEHVHFPALHGLHAELGPALDALVQDHRGFDASLAELLERVGRVPRDAIVKGFRSLSADLLAHEEREERLLAEATAGAGAESGSEPGNGRP